MPYYLVTGGAGFIGSHIVAELVARGERVRVLDNFLTGHRANLTPYINQIELIEGDIRHYATVREAVEGIDFVLHQAALPSVPRSVRDPQTSNEINISGTLNVLQAARDAKVQRLIFASSSSIYGNNPVLPKQELMPTKPMSPYAIAKLAAELYCRNFWPLYGFETIALRYFNVFGPGQDPTSQYAAVIPKFITAMLNGQPPTIYGDGSQSRDFTYITNVVEANLRACTATQGVGEVFNIACNQRHSLLQVVDYLADIIGCSAVVNYNNRRPGDVPHSQADITLARTHLGYEPKIDFVTGLRQTVKSFQQAAIAVPVSS